MTSAVQEATTQRTFAAELAAWGPESARPTIDVADAQRYCRDLGRSHYENFPVVSWLLPRRFHRDFFNVYAYCRWADDLADEVAGTEESLRLLDWWRRQLHDLFESGRATHPVFVALARTIADRTIPIGPFEDLLDAFEQDQRVRSYEDFDQLHDYCRRSANPVGRLVLYVLGEVSETNFVLSDSICTGLQLANFWQDVARDHEIGRVYLPRTDRERFGYTEAHLEDRVTNDAFVELMRFEVDRARRFLRAGLPLAARMPGRLQVDVELFARGGLRILDRIETIGFRVWDRRPRVTKFDALGLFVGCLFRACGRRLIPFGPRDSVDARREPEAVR